MTVMAMKTITEALKEKKKKNKDGEENRAVRLQK